MSANITARAKYLLNKMNLISNDIQLGTVLDTMDSINTLTSAHIRVGNASNVPVDVAVTGDVTISNAGVTAIGANKVTKAMLASTITPSHIVVAAAKYTTTGGNAVEDKTISGVLATDIVMTQLAVPGGTAKTILSAVTATGKITVTFSGDPSTDHQVYYQILRAAT